MPFFRKKPVVIEAKKVPFYEDAEEHGLGIVEYLDACLSLAEWCGGRSYMMHSDPCERYYDGDPGYDHILIPTLEGDMRAVPGSWIIRGVDGEFYSCDPDIFAKTYDLVTGVN